MTTATVTPDALNQAYRDVLAASRRYMVAFLEDRPETAECLAAYDRAMTEYKQARTAALPEVRAAHRRVRGTMETI